MKYFLIFGFLYAPTIFSQSIKVAVASSFTPILKDIVSLYSTKSTVDIKIISGSSGKLYAMISNGAPFDLFLSADSDKAQKLVSRGIAVKPSLYTYAIGKLVLWSNGPYIKDLNLILKKTSVIKTLSIANPKLAPYGKAAKEVLESFQVEKLLRNKIIMGENVSQVYNFVLSKNVIQGFIPLSLAIKGKLDPRSYWVIPQKFYNQITQQLVILKRSKVQREVGAFLSFLKTPKVQALIIASGHDI